MNAIIGCEESQAVCIEFRKLGHNAFSCDLQKCSGGHPEWHFKMDILNVIQGGREWDFAGMHPDCTFMTNSGVRWLFNSDGTKNIDRWIKLESAMNFFNLLKSKIKKGYLENPIPHKYARDGFYSVVTGQWVPGIGRYDQLIQPWQFGHGETKATCLWLIDLPKLKPTNIVPGRDHNIWKMSPGPDRAKLRSKTFLGIAKAIAEQYGGKII